MIHNNNDSNMYCSESQDESNRFYASEHPDEGGDCKREYDSGYESYDDDDLNQLCESVDLSPSETRRSSWVMQLLSQKTVDDTGCETWIEFQSMLKDEEEKEDTKRREQKEEQMTIEKMDAALKKQIKDDKNAEIMARLPTESRLGRLKRLKEARELQKRLKRNAWLDRKARRNKPQKNLPFGHRRNGGGKSRARPNARVGSDAAKQQDEVTKSRRALHRKQVKLSKKVSEDLRKEEFKNGIRTVEKSIIIKVDHIKEEEPEDEEEIIKQQIEKDIEEEEQNRIRQLICTINSDKIQEELITKKENEKEINKKYEMMVEKRLLEKERERDQKQDVLDNGSWTEVKLNTKKESKKESKKKEKFIEPVLLLINFTTPKMERDQQVEKGLRFLTNKTEMRTSLKSTKMCNSVILKKKCRHGTNCRYAHSIDDLQVAECFFKESCNHVRKSGNDYVNSSTNKKCSFIHPGESMQCYSCRLGLPMALPIIKKSIIKKSIIKKIVKSCWNKVEENKVEENKVESLPIVDESWSVKKKRKTPVRKTPVRKTKDAFCESVGTGRSCRHGHKCRFQHVEESVDEKGQVILKVPKAMAIKAMQSAMKRGLKNVKVVVV